MSAPTSTSFSSWADPGDVGSIARSIVGRAQGTEQLEAFVSTGRSTTVRAYEGEVESLTSAEGQGVGIRVIDEGRLGFASCGTLDPEAVQHALNEARDNARLAEADEHVSMAAPDGVEMVPQDTWSEETVELSVEKKIARALELERATKGVDPRVASVRSAIFGDSSGQWALVSTRGIDVSGRGTSCQLSVSALASEGEETQTGGGYDAHWAPSGLDLEKVANDAATRATRLLGATQADSQTVTVMLEPRMAMTIVGTIVGMLNGEAVAKGRTPFAERMGEQIANSVLSVIDDPTDSESLGAEEFDGEGLACRPNALISSGELMAFLHNTESASRCQTTSTASAVRGWSSTPGVGAMALAITPGERDQAALIGDISNGIWVQSMTGFHSGVNTISGDFSVGVDGLMIRDGELAEPVREVTIASTLQRLLLDISEVGGDVERLPSGSTAVSLVIPGVALAGR